VVDVVADVYVVVVVAAVVDVTGGDETVAAGNAVDFSNNSENTCVDSSFDKGITN